MSTYTHDTYLGKDGITRCRICRLASYGPGILSGIPCKGGSVPIKRSPPELLDQIVIGAEPALPEIGTLWVDVNHNVWVWGETGSSSQAWIDIQSGQENRSHELRLPVTSKHPALREIGVVQQISNEMLRILDGDALDGILIDILRAMYNTARRWDIIATLPVLRTTEDPTYNSTQFSFTVEGRPLPTQLMGKVDITKRIPPVTTMEEFKRLTI